VEWHQSVRPRHRSKQGHKCWLDFNRERSNQRPQNRQISSELDRITQAMIAADEYVLPMEVASVPDPAQMVGQAWIVPLGGIATCHHDIIDPPRRGEVAPVHSCQPLCIILDCLDHAGFAPRTVGIVLHTVMRIAPP